MNPDAPAIDHAAARVVPVHTAVRGRARFKVAGLHRSTMMKRALESRLGDAPGIRQVSASELTGNLLVNFDVSYTIEHVAALIDRTLDGLALSKPAASRHPIDPAPEVTGDPIVPGPRMGGVQERAAWHTMEAGEVVTRSGSSIRSGLDSASAMRVLKKFGLNRLPESAARSQLAILLDQLTSTPILLLMAGAGTAILTGGLADAAVILGVVGVNAAIGFTTESRSERTLNSLRAVVTPSAVVVRDGKPRAIPAYQVAVGDILALIRK